MKIKGDLMRKSPVVLLSVLMLLTGHADSRESAISVQETETAPAVTEAPDTTEAATDTAPDPETTREAEMTDTEIIPETTEEPPVTETAAVTEEETAAKETKVREKVPLTEYTDGAYTYYIDVSSYLQYIEPEDTEKYLLLANRANPLPDPQNWVPSDLVVAYGSSAKMERSAAMAMKAMILEAKALGKYDSSPRSGYRSYSTQKSIYNRYKKQEAANHPKYTEEQVIARVDTYSARPGTSEHQTGLAIDFYPINQYFAYRTFYKYLTENAYRFGFILRYRKGDEDITGYKKEPWHWRFVGREAATYIHEHGIALEEYLELLYPGRYKTVASFYETSGGNSGVTTTPPPDTQSYQETETAADTGTEPVSDSSGTAEETGDIPDTDPTDISSRETAVPEETDTVDPGGMSDPPESVP